MLAIGFERKCVESEGMGKGVLQIISRETRALPVSYSARPCLKIPGQFRHLACQTRVFAFVFVFLRRLRVSGWGIEVGGLQR